MGIGISNPKVQLKAHSRGDKRNFSLIPVGQSIKISQFQESFLVRILLFSRICLQNKYRLWFLGPNYYFFNEKTLKMDFCKTSLASFPSLSEQN